MRLEIGKLYRVAGITKETNGNWDRLPVRFHKASFVGGSRTKLHSNTTHIGIELKENEILLFLGEYRGVEQNLIGCVFPTFLLGEHVISSVREAVVTYNYYKFEKVG